MTTTKILTANPQHREENTLHVTLTCRDVQRAHFPHIIDIISRGKRSRNILKLIKSPFLHVEPP